MKEIDLFNPQKSFFSLGIVWATTLFFVTISIIIGVIIYTNSNLNLELSYLGWNNAINIFKVPISLLALLIPIGAIFAANHRSKQTMEQMNLTIKQNTFSNYYKHLEEFEKFCKLKEVKYSTRHLHRVTFPNAISGNYSYNNNLSEIIGISISSLFSRLSESNIKKEVLLMSVYFL